MPWWTLVLPRLCCYCKLHGHEGQPCALCSSPDGDCAPEPPAGPAPEGTPEGRAASSRHGPGQPAPAQEPAAHYCPIPRPRAFRPESGSRMSPPRSDGRRAGAANPQPRDAPRLAGGVGRGAQATPCAPPAWLRRGLGVQVPTPWWPLNEGAPRRAHSPGLSPGPDPP